MATIECSLGLATLCKWRSTSSRNNVGALTLMMMMPSLTAPLFRALVASRNVTYMLAFSTVITWICLLCSESCSFHTLLELKVLIVSHGHTSSRIVLLLRGWGRVPVNLAVILKWRMCLQRLWNASSSLRPKQLNSMPAPNNRLPQHRLCIAADQWMHLGSNQLF